MDEFSKLVQLIVCFCLFVPKFNAVTSIFTIIALLLVCLKLRSKIFNTIKSMPRDVVMAYSIFLLSLIVSSIAVGDESSIKKSVDWVYYCLPFFITYFLAKVTDTKQWVFYGFVLGLAYSTAYGFYDYIQFDRNRLGGLYNCNHMGSMLDIMLPLTIVYFFECYRENKLTKFSIVLTLITCLGSVVALVLTGSRGAILGVTIGFILSAILYGYRNLLGKKFILLLGVVTLVSCTSLFALYSLNNNKFSREYDNERILLLQSSYAMWSDHKFFGVGLTNWREEYKSKYISSAAKEPNLGMPHNIIAYYFSTTGLVGGIGFVIFSLLILKYLYTNLVPISREGLYCFAMLWAFFAISLHGLVDIGITKKEIFRLFCGTLGLTVAIIQSFKTKYKTDI